MSMVEPERESDPLSTGPSQASRVNWANRVTLFFAVGILTFVMAAFVGKLIEFVNTFSTDSGGVFAITPMVNYLLASLGFLCMLIWATFNGMFHDMEQPKQTMLERDQLLDRPRP